MEHLERAGLVAFVPILGTTPGRQAVNPRKVYAVDTALAAALSPEESFSRERLFATMITSPGNTMRFFIRPNAEDVTLSWPKRALSQAAYRLVTMETIPT